MVRIRFCDGMEATLKGGNWTTDNPLWVEKLNLMQQEYGGRVWEGGPDYAAARYIAERLGADIVDYQPPPTESVPGRVY